MAARKRPGKRNLGLLVKPKGGQFGPDGGERGLRKGVLRPSLETASELGFNEGRHTVSRRLFGRDTTPETAERLVETGAKLARAKKADTKERSRPRKGDKLSEAMKRRPR